MDVKFNFGKHRESPISCRANVLCICLFTMLPLSGCAVENQYLAKMPLFEAKSDVIPGLDPPAQRKKAIQEKGNRGATASEADREILVYQLLHEYQTSPDPNMRRESVDALAKIPHPQRDQFLLDIIRDNNPFVRMSALEALGNTYSGSKEELSAILIGRIKADTDKDVRLTSIRILGNIVPNQNTLAAQDAELGEWRQSVALELGGLLDDRVPAVRYEAMRSLQKITNKDYGTDINRWHQYVRYLKKEVSELPPERTMAEKMPRIALPMFR